MELNDCVDLIKIYARMLTKYIEEHGDDALGAITDDVTALTALVAAVCSKR